MEYITKIEMIAKKYSEDELIGKLSERCSNLLQTALKVRECIKEGTYDTYEENIELLHEKMAEFFICIYVLDSAGVISMEKIISIEDRKQFT